MINQFRLMLCASLLFGVVHISMAEETDESILFKENFEKPLEAPWKWVNENPETHALEDGKLKIQLEPGGLMGAGVDAKNILIRPNPEEARWVEVAVTVEHAEQYEQAGLILYHDGDNYIKFVLEHVDGENWLVLVKEVNTHAEVVYKGGPVNDKALLRLGINDEEIKAFGIVDDDTTKVSVTIFSTSMQDYVGIFTQSGRADAKRFAYFDDFIIKK